MLTDRQVDHSVLDRLAALFTSPPNGFENPFHVYYEDDFHNPLFAPEAPYLWVVSGNVRPTKSRLPLLVVRRSGSGWLPFELGNREGQVFGYSISAFGRNGGEASDLIGFLKKNLDPIPIYDYDEDPKVVKYYAHLDAITAIPADASGELGIEGALAHQENLVFSFPVKEL